MDIKKNWSEFQWKVQSHFLDSPPNLFSFMRKVSCRPKWRNKREIEREKNERICFIHFILMVLDSTSFSYPVPFITYSEV